MGKATIVTDAITIVGMIAIGALMFAQVPGMIDDMKNTLSQESVRAQSVEIANLVTLVSASPDNIEIIHELPSGISYTVSIDDGNVAVEAGSYRAVAKTFSTLEFGRSVVKSLSITKNKITRVE